jgi:TolB-like protein/DNA-binding winged helix-turn-helix (wHTH) protein
MPAQDANYRFGRFELRIRTKELYKDGTKLKLRSQPFHVLQALVIRAGDVVTREELRDLLWPKETFVDFQHGLNASMSELRGVLNDTASAPRYIETLPKVGYRIMLSVELVRQSGPAAEPTTPSLIPPATALTTPKMLPQVNAVPPAKRRWGLATGILLASLLALAGFIQFSRARFRRHSAVGPTMLAVLPFENITGDTGQEYFSDGLTEEMIAQLGRLDPQHIRVIARTSVMRYKQDHAQLEKVGRELGVQYVLEGTVRHDADKVRISVQLIQMKDQTNIWSHQYDRELSNLLALQSEIAQEIVSEIRVTLGEPKRIESAVAPPLGPQGVETYELYLKGRYFWNKRTLSGFQKAIEYFQQAINKDPLNARAYAGLADSYALMSGYAGIPFKEQVPKAHAAARRAIELNERLPEAHTSMAVVAQNFDWDWATAEQEYRRAIELDPNYSTAHHWYAEFLALMGRFDEAFVEIERARQLDPLSLIIAADHGVILYYARQYDRAIEQFRAVQEMDPHFPRAALLYVAYAQKRMYAESLAGLKEWPGRSPWIWADLAYVYDRSGHPKEAQHAFRELQKMDRIQQMDPLVFVLASIGMNEMDQAIRYLEKAYDEHSEALNALKVDPLYDPLRVDPRFKEIMRKMRFPE